MEFLNPAWYADWFNYLEPGWFEVAFLFFIIPLALAMSFNRPWVVVATGLFIGAAPWLIASTLKEWEGLIFLLPITMLAGGFMVLCGIIWKIVRVVSLRKKLVQ